MFVWLSSRLSEKNDPPPAVCSQVGRIHHQSNGEHNNNNSERGPLMFWAGGGELSRMGRHKQLKREGASLHHVVEKKVVASSQGWVVDVLLNRKGGALHCTTKRLS